MNLDEAKYLIEHEHNSASVKFPPFNSAHEGFAVLKEEVDELWEEVKKNPNKDPYRTTQLDGTHDGDARRRAKMRAEAIQVAAMAIRFITDCT